MIIKMLIKSARKRNR
ncbi:hypothetical protein HVX31_16465 [Escherichia coli]|nr:hypothetical protein HVZ30_17095 [Escherichia coli]QML62460.1 hypothetical protein HVX31_16465 [Escherichia coli]